MHCVAGSVDFLHGDLEHAEESLALFYADHARQAAATYVEAMAGHPDPARLDEKLSDVYFKLGNLSKERHPREGVGGALK